MSWFNPLNPKNFEAKMTLVILGILFAGSLVSPSAYRYRPREDTTLKKVFRTMQKRGLNRDAAASQTAGYYEGLLDQAANVTQVGGRGWLDWRFWLIERTQQANREAEYTRFTNDFLRHELLPNINRRDVGEGRRHLVTNSMGMADKEYSQTPSAATWRIALIGDSVSQGAGTNFGENYEARLEEHLNQKFAGQNYERYEILNFSVQGYLLTQLVDVGVSRVPPFSPNLYILALTERSVFTSWADHIASLVLNGIDLKYDFLRKVVRDAAITRNLSNPLITARLSPYRVEIMRWALEAIRERAHHDGAALVVFLVPTADDPEIQIEQFTFARQLLAEMSIPTVDLLETFAYLEDIAPVRVSAADKHPNREGHRMLFEAVLESLESDAELRRMLTGAR